MAKEAKIVTGGGVGTTAFLNITVPRRLLDGLASVTLDGAPSSFMLSGNATHTSAYVSYSQSPHVIKTSWAAAIPEYPAYAPVLAVTTAILLATLKIIGKKRSRDGLLGGRRP